MKGVETSVTSGPTRGSRDQSCTTDPGHRGNSYQTKDGIVRVVHG